MHETSNSPSPVARWTLLVIVAVMVVTCANSSEKEEVSPTPSSSAVSTSQDQSVEVIDKAKNIILFIGDGVDVHQLTIARAYLYGLDGSLSFDQFPFQASARVRTVSEDDGKTPVYVADSANTATSIASGIVTSRGRIGTSAVTDDDVPTVVELAREKGRKTGIVSTAAITDATPASFMAHTRLRFCQGPDEMNGTSQGLPGCPNDTKAKGGMGSIAEQVAASGVDVLLGGGTRYFAQTSEEGEVLTEWMEQAGYKLVDNAKELAAVNSTETPKVLGLFGASTLPTEWAGEDGKSSAAVEVDGGKVTYPEPFSCEANPGFGQRPTLAAMTDKAIEVLAAQSEDAGFFLMVESASIDKQAHAMNPCGQIGETKALSDSVQLAVDFATERGDTLVIVTSDHGHAPQIIPYPSLFSAYAPNSGMAMYPPGRVALLEPEAGGILAISYGTNARYLEEHTGGQIPVFAMGPGAEQVKGLINQSDLFEIMLRAWGDR